METNRDKILDTHKPLLDQLQNQDPGIHKNNYKTSNLKLFLISSAAIISLISIYLMWFTDIYNFIIIQKVVPRNGSEILDWYLTAPFPSAINVYMFNYTNLEDFMSGKDKKLKLEQLGPYAYGEMFEKTNVNFEGDDITWQENRSHKFLPEMSGSNKEDDVIIMPNIPLLASIPVIEKLPFFLKIGFNTILTLTKPKEFHNLTVRDYCFGYTDDFLNAISTFKWDFKPEDLGIIASRRGISKYRTTVNLGLKNVDIIGKVMKFNGKTNFSIWKTEQCNAVPEGNMFDGLLNSPKTIRNKEQTLVFAPDLCRSLPIIFEKEDIVYGNIPAYRYISPENVFSKEPDNEYYCELQSVKDEHINGVLDISDCIEGSPPAIASNPHFYQGSEKLYEYIDGLSPNKSLHESYTLLHPRLGVPIYGNFRMQMNFKIFHHKKYYQKFPKGLILPIGWIERTLYSIPKEFKFKLYLSTIVVDFVEVVLKYGSIIIFASSISYLVWYIKRDMCSKQT